MNESSYIQNFEKDMTEEFLMLRMSTIFDQSMPNNDKKILMDQDLVSASDSCKDWNKYR